MFRTVLVIAALLVLCTEGLRPEGRGLKKGHKWLQAVHGSKIKAPTESRVIASAPYTAFEYINSLRLGFDTDFFKANSPTKNYPADGRRMMADLYSRGVRHLRLRSNADIYGYAEDTFDASSMGGYLDQLEIVVSDMLSAKLFPIISWIHHKAESRASPSDKVNYLDWWRRVATRLRNYDYPLAFNLFTELGEGNLQNASIYNSWTSEVIDIIRGSGGLNAMRVLILGAPSKDAQSLANIDPKIYRGKSNLVAEWHLYASGPNKKDGRKHWEGTGSQSDRDNVDEVMNYGQSFTAAHMIPTWIGAWMPYDNIDGSLLQDEVQAFACYFSLAAKVRGIPWAMNKLENFYDIKTYQWIQYSNIQGQVLDMPSILQSTECAMMPASFFFRAYQS